MNNYRTKRSAFTLVELLVVIAAITILAAVTLPSLKSILDGQKVTNASRVIKAHLEAAKARAIASGRPVAAIMERNANEANTVTRLSIGQIFPPYSGDTANARGVLTDAWGPNGTFYEEGLTDGYYDRLTVSRLEASLLSAGVVRAGDFIQIGDSDYIYAIRRDPVVDTSTNTVSIDFVNPPVHVFADGTELKTHEEQLPLMQNAQVRFRVFRKPTKSFVQTSILPRGTCIDMTVSGQGQFGNEFRWAAHPPQPTMVVFAPNGQVSYVDRGDGIPRFASGIIHLMVGRTDQVGLTDAELLSVVQEADTNSFTANLNDEGNSWISINPFSGQVYGSQLLTGFEETALVQRIAQARSLATTGVNYSEN